MTDGILTSLRDNVILIREILYIRVMEIFKRLLNIKTDIAIILCFVLRREKYKLREQN